MMLKERNYGIDLLRIVAMFMVTVLHVQGHGGVLANANGLFQIGIYNLLEVIVYCAIDIYALISGYVANDTDIRTNKILKRWFQVFFYSFIVTGIVHLLGVYDFNRDRGILLYLFPVSNSIYWYFTSYFVVMLISPYIKRLMDCLTDKESKVLLYILFIVFSIVSLFGDDVFGLENGYTVLWITILFLMGMIIKKIRLFENVETKYLVITIIVCVVLTMMPYVMMGHGILTNYVSPTILIQAICYLIIFSRIDADNKYIKLLAPLTFGSYLFQDNPVIRSLFIENKFIFITNINVLLGLPLELIISLVVLAIGMGVEFIRIKLYEMIKIDKLCNSLSTKIENIFSKLVELI